MHCSQCRKRFIVTKYTQPHPNKADGWLCHECCISLGIDPFAKAKKAVPRKVDRKEQRKLVSYEDRKGAPALGDLCIKVRTIVSRCGRRGEMDWLMQYLSPDSSSANASKMSRHWVALGR